jgi:phosphatidylglycerol:prolipoprotein diacylglycerol transferase
MNVSSTYPLIMLAALATGWWLLKHQQSDLPLPAWQKMAIGMAAFCGAMLGAKLPFALSDWEGLLSGSAWFANGKTIMCGMVGAYLAVELVKWIYGIKVKTGDTFAVPIAVTVGIGRLGCFVAGCCYGTPTSLPWAVTFPSVDQIPRHPTQIYETLFHLLMAGILMQLQKRSLPWLRGQLVKLYIMSYLTYRFFTELIRPEPEMLVGLTAYQWFALAMLPCFALLWWHDAAQPRAKVAAASPPDQPGAVGG